MYLCCSMSIKEETVWLHMKKWGVEEKKEETDVQKENYEDIRKRISGQKQVVIVFTSDMMTNIFSLVELEIIHQLFMEQKIYVMTFFKGVNVGELPERFVWLKNTKILFLEGTLDIYRGMGMVLQAKMENYHRKYGGWKQCNKTKKWVVNQDMYLQKLSEMYKQLEPHNRTARMVAIYCMYIYVSVKYQKSWKETRYGVWLNKIFCEMDIIGGMQTSTYMDLAEQCMGLVLCEIQEFVGENISLSDKVNQTV